MKSHRRSLEELIRKLPPDAEEEARDFLLFLLERKAKKSHGKPKFEWAGSLRELRDRYTSVELQHEISKWRL